MRVHIYLQVIDALDASLDDKYDADVHGVREILLDKNTMAAVLILCDVLNPVIYFSDYLQGNNELTNVNEKVKVNNISISPQA